MSDYIPHDVLFNNIFTRLPIKSLLRFTSVCKSWKSLITNPSFIDSHLNRPPTQEDLLLVRTCESKKEIYSLHCDNDTFDEYTKLDFPFHRAASRYYRIVGSCNGLICLTDDQWTYVHNTILWNPSIRKWVSLPRPRVTYATHGGFDHAFGFGFDPKSNDYKVVRIVHLEDDDELPPQVDVYTLSTGTWRDISHLGLDFQMRGRAKQAYLNGAAHWIGSDKRERRIVVVSFHMGDEVFCSMEQPTGVEFYDAWSLTPAVIQGSLSLVEQDEDEDTLRVWVMKEYGVASSWTKLFDIGIEGIDRVIGLRKKGDVLIDSKGDLISYDPPVAQVKKVGIRSRTKGWYQYSFHIESYIESLVLLGIQVKTEEDVVRCEEEEDKVGSEQEKVEDEDGNEEEVADEVGREEGEGDKQV